MITFLKILLAVFVVIVVLIGVGWLWVKRKLTQSMGDYSAAAALLGDLQFEPARLQLHRAEFPAFNDEFENLSQDLRRIGFHRMADLEDHSGAFLGLRACRHKELPAAAVAVQYADDSTSFMVFAIDSDHRVTGRGGGRKEHIAMPRIDWQQDPGTTPEAALADVLNHVSKASLPIDLKLCRAIYEQVYAARMDQKIVHAPTRESIVAMAEERGEPHTDEQIDSAYDMLFGNWQMQIEDAVLDRYRRSSAIDAVSWENMRDDVQVVHARIDDDQIAAMLAVDDLAERIFDQCVAQGLTGTDLFTAVSERLPPDRQWKTIGEVDRPVRALLVAPNEDIESDVRTARRYVYEAENADGQTVQGGIVAQSGADAKQQIANLGLQNAKLLLEPGPGEEELDDVLIDEQSAIIAARSVREGIFVSILRALLGNWLIWAPPTLLLAKTWYDGTPYGWGDYVVFGWSALAVLALVFLVAPVYFYNQLLMAQLKAQPGRARIWIGLLGLTGRLSGIGHSQLVTEKCKVLAEEGKLDDALELRERDRAELTEEEYQSALVAIFSAAGDWPSMIRAQRAYLQETPAKETATVDLAMSLARYTDDVDAAEPLIQSISPADLPEVALIGYQYVRGLIAAHRGRNAQALRHFGQAIDTAEQFRTLPIMLGLIAEINGHAALAFKRGGDPDRARVLWEDAWPILKLHRSSERLIAAFRKD